MNKALFVTKKYDHTMWLPSCWLPNFPEEKGMCDINSVDKLLVILVKAEIAKYVKDRYVFSAWDITKSIRALVGSDYNVSHNDVRTAVQSWFEGTNDKNEEEWTRTLIRVKNGKVTFVYHPLTVMAEKYPVFDSLVDTMTSYQGKTADERIAENSEPEGPDYEEAYEELLDASVTLRDAVDFFLDGQTNLEELRESKEDFDSCNGTIGSNLSDTESEKNDNG